MSNEIETTDNRNYAFDMFKAAQDEVRKLNITDKQAVIDICQAGMHVLANQLQDNDIMGAIDTQNKMDAFTRYMRSIPKSHANYTWNVNKMADTHVRMLRMTGGKLKKHIYPSKQEGKEKMVQLTEALEEPKISSDDLEKKYNIKYSNYYLWKMLSEIDDEKFEAYLHPYLDGNVENGLIFYWTHLYNHFYSNPSTPEKLPIAMTPAQATLYKAARDLYAAFDDAIQDIGEGKTPAGVIQYNIDYLKRIPEETQNYIKQAKEAAGLSIW